MVSVQSPQAAEGGIGESPSVHILSDRCSGCQECIVRCPTGALSLDPARWIASSNDALCVGCRQCERSCPFSAIFVEGPVVQPPSGKSGYVPPGDLVGSVREADTGFQTFEEMARAAERCLDCPDPTCVKGCPAHNNIPEFIRMALKGDLERAREVISLNSCLPGACSRVCDWGSQCEGSCTWTLAGAEAVEIGKIERYIADHSSPVLEQPIEGLNLKVAVLGAGPGGAGAAYELARHGCSVTVFEKNGYAGGVMKWGIPSYVLPDSTWQNEFRALEDSGVEFRYGTDIAPESVGELLNEFDAVITATGAEQQIVPKIPGTSLDGVVSATDFLTSSKDALGTARFEPTLTGKKVLVLGAGNTALDVARTVVRMGGEAVAIDWTDEKYAKARPDEIADARKEGVEVRFLTTPKRLVGDNSDRVTMVELFDTSQTDALSLPVIMAGSGYLLEVDMVVTAMGYRVGEAEKKLSSSLPLGAMVEGPTPLDRRWLGSGLFAAGNPTARLAYDREYARTEAAFPISNRIWAVGDVRVGPSTVVSSMAQGISAARGVMAELSKKEVGMTPNGTGSRKKYLGSVLIIHDGASDMVKKSSEYMGRVFWGAGWDVTHADLAHLDHLELLGTDLVIVGSQVEGLILGAVHPSRRAAQYIPTLPSLYGKKVATFVTHSLTARDSGDQLKAMLVGRGATVVATGEIYRKALAEDSKRFAQVILEQVLSDRSATV